MDKPIATDPIEDGSAVIGHDAFDVQAWLDANDLFPKLGDAIEDVQKRVITGAALMRDAFWSYLKAQPIAEPVVPLTAVHAINRRIVEEVMTTAEWNEVRAAGTVGDPMYATIAALAMTKAALEQLDPTTIERIAQIAGCEQEVANLWTKAEALDGIAQNADPRQAAQLFAQAEEMRTSATQKQEEMLNQQLEVEATLDDVADNVRRAARHAQQVATTEIEGIEAAINTYSDGYSQGAQLLSTKEKITLAQKVGTSARLKEIAALCGRLTRIALDVQRTQVKHPPDEIISITKGRDLAHLLPSQWAYLADLDTEDIFYHDFAHGRLLQYDLVGNEKQGQGPIIVALDSSGSMAERAGGISKEAWSKAVMLALLAIARKQKRDMAVLHFSDVGELMTYRFPKGAAIPVEVIACADFFFGNGTVFEGWMTGALAMVDEAVFDRADVICITDGLTTIDPIMRDEWQRRRDEREMRAFGVLIGSGAGTDVLASVTDSLMTFADLANDRPVLDTIFAV